MLRRAGDVALQENACQALRKALRSISNPLQPPPPPAKKKMPELQMNAKHYSGSRHVEIQQSS